MLLTSTDAQRRISRQLAAIWLLLFITLAALALVFLPALKPDTNILNLLPQDKQHPLIHKAQQQINAQWQNTVIWLAQGEDDASAVANAQQLQQQLQHSGLFSELTLQWQAQQSGGLYTALLPYRFQLLSADDKHDIAEDAAAFAAKRLQLLYSPAGMQYAMTLQYDPLFTFGMYSNQLMGEQDIELFDDIVVLREGAQVYALLLSSVKEQGFAGQKALAQLHRQLTGESILAAGMPLYSAYGAESAEREMSTVGTVSVLAIIAFMLLGFRSLTPLLLSLLSIITGVTAAVLACVLVFGQLHVITLVFGSSLISITVDYSFHYFCDRLRKDAGSAINSLQTVLPGITLGVGSSMIAYGILLFTPFPALQQIGLFSVSGLLAAWFTVVLLFPLITQRLKLRDSVPLPALYHVYLHGWPQFFRRFRYVLLALAVVWLIAGWTRLSTQDDIRAMQKPAANVLAQEQKIMEVGRQRQDGQYFIISAENSDALLLRERQLLQKLDGLINEGQLSAYQALSTVLFTGEEQQQHWQLLNDKLFSSGILHSSMQQLSMQPAAIADIEQAFYGAQQQQLSVDVWAAAASPQWQALWLGCDEHCSSIVRLSGIRDAQVLGNLAALADGNSVYFVDTVGDINHMLQQYRHIATGFLLAALLLIGVFLSVFTGWQRALRIVAATLVAQLLALATLGLLGFSVSMFHVFGLLLALGISMDYAIFQTVGKHPLTVAMAVLLSLLTSLLAFGLLASSGTAFIQAFGLSLALGIFYAFILAPLFTDQVNTKGL